ncbi:MAG: hypothetical protein QOC63_3886 [Mycobacterium sp.]|nr:hypothetical protein [Mycobacterium sp.]
MPIYQCSSPQRLLTKSAKGKIASEITAFTAKSPANVRRSSTFCS